MGVLHWKAQTLKILPGAYKCTVSANKMKKTFQMVSIGYVKVDAWCKTEVFEQLTEENQYSYDFLILF